MTPFMRSANSSRNDGGEPGEWVEIIIVLRNKVAINLQLEIPCFICAFFTTTAKEFTDTMDS